MPPREELPYTVPQRPAWHAVQLVGLLVVWPVAFSMSGLCVYLVVAHAADINAALHVNFGNVVLLSIISILSFTVADFTTAMEGWHPSTFQQASHGGCQRGCRTWLQAVHCHAWPPHWWGTVER